MSRDSFRDIRFEFNYSRSQFWFFHWLSLANPVLPTEITICRFADEWWRGCSITPCSAAPAYYQFQVYSLFSFAFKQFREHFLDELYMTDRYFMTKMIYLFETRYFQAILTKIVLCVTNFHPFLLRDSSKSNQRLGKC